MIKSLLKLIAQYSLTEIFWFIYSSISYRMAKKIPRGFKESREVFPEIMSQGFSMKRHGGINRISWNGLQIDVRRNTSDVLVFKQILIDEEYDPVVKLFEERGKRMFTMIDGGANIGLTTLYFYRQFPEARIIALEPSGENFVQLTGNLKLNALTGIIPINAGVWNSNKHLSKAQDFGDGRHWAFSLTESESGTFKVFDIPTLLTEYNIEVLDFLKLDVEGAEYEILLKADNLNFLEHVNVISIEVHKKSTIHQYVKVLETYKMSWFLSGEILVGYRSLSFL